MRLDVSVISWVVQIVDSWCTSMITRSMHSYAMLFGPRNGCEYVYELMT